SEVVTVDNLSYAGNVATLSDVIASQRHFFEHEDICDPAALRRVFANYNPSAVVHLAAETHVDRSIDDPSDFIRTNVVGSANLLETARHHLRSTPNSNFRFVHVSTDEVFGSLGEAGTFNEGSRYDPSSPYSAS